MNFNDFFNRCAEHYHITGHSPMMMTMSHDDRCELLMTIPRSEIGNVKVVFEGEEVVTKLFGVSLVVK